MIEINCELLITKEEVALIGFELNHRSLVWFVKRDKNKMILNDGQQDIYLVGEIKKKHWKQMKDKKIIFIVISEKGKVINKMTNFTLLK